MRAVPALLVGNFLRLEKHIYENPAYCRPFRTTITKSSAARHSYSSHIRATSWDVDGTVCVYEILENAMPAGGLVAQSSKSEVTKLAPRLVVDAPNRPTRGDAEAAVHTLLQWAGDDPARSGLIDTPKRVTKAFEEYFAGYKVDAAELLRRTFDETEGYDEMVILRDIEFTSFCEHHLAPIMGRAHIAYIPVNRVVGISKLARVVDAFARRLQIQERLTAQIADTIDEVLQPKGVGVVIEATHHCMTTRGVKQHGTSMVTSRILGQIRKDPATRREFLSLLGHRSQGAMPV